MRTRGTVALALTALVAVGVIGGYWYERPLLLTGTGYAAHNACALEHVAGRSDSQTDLPPNPLVPVLRTAEVGDTGSRSSVLGVLAAQQAVFTEGFGCTLADQPPALPVPTEVDPGANPFASVAAPTMSADDAAALAEAFGDDLPADARAALGTRAVLVVRGGELVAERYADGFDAATPQLGWSMTKSVTHLLVGRLVAEDRIALDEDHLRAEWIDARAQITVDQLLRMTSGLAWDETYDLGTPITRMLYLEPDMGDYVAGRPLEHEPGSYQQYSSGSTTLLCDVLLERTGTDANLPRDLLFAPLGMASAVLEPDASGTPVCGSYLWATPRDWAALGQFALQGGQWQGEQLLPQGWLADATVPMDVPTQDPGYGSGWWLKRLADGALVHPELPADAYFAQGHDGQWIAVVPSADLVVVRLGFTPEADSGVVALTARLIAAG